MYGLKKLWRNGRFRLWPLYVLIIFLLVWQSAQLMIRPIHGDEATHAHTAYLLSHGNRQFVDFFEHHSPGLWYLLIPYYLLGGYGAGVLFWGRVLCVISLFITTALCYYIGRRTGPPLAGEFAAVLPLPFGIANEYLQVRPEVVMLPLVLGAIYCSLRFLQKKEERKWLIIGLALVSLSLFYSPRSLIVLIWLLITYVVYFRRFRFHHHILALTAIAIGPLIVLAVVGWHDCYFWIYKLPQAFVPGLSLRDVWELLSDQYVIVLGVLGSLAAIYFARGATRYIAGLAMLTVALLYINIRMGIGTPPYAWAIGSILTAIILAYWCAYFLNSPRTLFRIITAVLLFGWLIFSLRALARPSYMLSLEDGSAIPNPATLSEEVAEMDAFCRRYENQGPAWIVWDYDVIYIRVENFSYYWSVSYDMPNTFLRLGIKSPVPQWLEDIRLRLPFVISKNLVDESLPGPGEEPKWWAWFTGSYRLLKRPRGDYLYWRFDVQVSSEDIADDQK